MDLQLAAAGAIPAIFAMAYVDRLDRKRPEPATLLRRAAIAGGLSTLPCIFLQLGLHQVAPLEGLSGALFTSYFAAGAVEETAKALAFLLIIRAAPEFDERFDGIVYATRAGLGFALVENVGYLLKSHSIEGWAATFIARAVLAVPGHALWSGMVGYFYAKARFDRRGPGLLGGLLLAILLHGSYDAALFSMPVAKAAGLGALVLPLMLVPVVVILGCFAAMRAMTRAAILADDEGHLGHHAPIILQALPVAQAVPLALALAPRPEVPEEPR